MIRLPLWLLLGIALVLAACSSATTSASTQPEGELTASSPTQSPATPALATAIQPAQQAGAQALQLPELIDSQGAVTVIVKPLDLYSSEDTLNFEVALETHSIDLSMDLAALAILSTDTGLSVQALLWDAPLGGHHVSGTLSFPANVGGKPVLEGVSKLILTIKDLDAPERVFTWDVNR